jgi:hypothetical protein
MAAYSSEGKGVRNTNYSIDAHILPVLGHLEVQELMTARLRKWRDDLAASPARLRSALGREPAFRSAPDGPEAIRRRRSTANRVLTILKAALNHAWNEGKVPSGREALWTFSAVLQSRAYSSRNANARRRRTDEGCVIAHEVTLSRTAP